MISFRKTRLMGIFAAFLCFTLLTVSCDRKETASGSPERSATSLPNSTAAVSYEKQPATNIPSLYIELKDGRQKREIHKGGYLDATYSLVGEGYSAILDAPVSVKGRGNFSWSFDKKPLTLKLDQKTDWLGMGKGKTWVLVNNYVDKTLLRNYLSFCFAADMGLEFTPECRFVDVFLNGEYEGNYLLCEKITISEGRVDIQREQNRVLFEIEMDFRHEDCSQCYVLSSGVHIMYKDYDKKKDLNLLMQEINPFLKKADRALRKGIEEYSQYIDVDSFINWYIVNEFAKNFDSKFVTSCYCYIGNDGKLHMGPIWDMDTCYGNQNTDGCMYPKGFHVSQAPWYSILLKDKDFQQKLKERWSQVMESGVIAGLLNHIEQADALISRSRELNFDRWPEALDYKLRDEKVYYTYEEELEHLKAFIKDRRDWLDAQWNIGNSAGSEGQSGSRPSGEILNAMIEKASVKGSPGANEGETVQFVFDENTDTKFCTVGSFPVSIAWKMKEPVRIKKYAIATANDALERNPKHWKLFGSEDGKSWVSLSEVKNGSLPLSYYTYKEFQVKQSGTYLHYKLMIYESSGKVDATQLSELVLMG